MNRAVRLLVQAGLLAGLAALPHPAPTAASITGIYSLSQVPDAGGELRLDPNGRYDWAVSVGRANRSSVGRWIRKGDRILLKPDDPENPSGFTRRAELSDWNDLAERLYLRADFETAWATLLDRCPLLRVKVLSYPALPDRATDDWRGYADKAGREALQAREQANAAIARWAATRNGTAAWHNSLREASEAIAAYYRTNYYSEQAHARAGIDPPPWEPLAYPAKCLPQRAPADSEPLPPERHPRIGVIVGDPEAASTFMGVRLAMIFSDGAQVQAVSGPGGWASLPVRPRQSLVAIRLSIDDADPAPIRVPVELSGAGLVIVDINPDAGAARSLEPASLQISADGSLRGSNGIYVR